MDIHQLLDEELPFNCYPLSEVDVQMSEQRDENEEQYRNQKLDASHEVERHSKGSLRRAQAALSERLVECGETEELTVQGQALLESEFTQLSSRWKSGSGSTKLHPLVIEDRKKTKGVDRDVDMSDWSDEVETLRRSFIESERFRQLLENDELASAHLVFLQSTISDCPSCYGPLMYCLLQWMKHDSYVQNQLTTQRNSESLTIPKISTDVKISAVAPHRLSILSQFLRIPSADRLQLLLLVGQTDSAAPRLLCQLILLHFQTREQSTPEDIQLGRVFLSLKLGEPVESSLDLLIIACVENGR